MVYLRKHAHCNLHGCALSSRRVFMKASFTRLQSTPFRLFQLPHIFLAAEDL